ncbi:MAG: glycosyltransferase family 1 protein [Candidatus Portnoybacteria bacterium CG_4_10_14_0_2_um_filter_43_36]|uniref:Glycosyltransferase family 1 protein n=3 Tax=Candidatus Portnoyibacteriota TaxID=1817913 RepID=A0A2M7YLT0_9BACT|nr:MAG: group 1 glycosyl transferase [Candidatus Portnoybacteria bacterium CG23_combo_of_CG06-09_8_20_14_all_44_36]PIZ69958.1 MAG: glycosyltransferase family 1 protein [Candidatus Portnoybacteria bacterium CG_4_10_14_0_2_um_filter_43_36]PJA63945.1 MAG: glycosyltransferase family 1 protein [Candidatus Portnoybacteria bacterium CG_4_9_14_3_um_filter_43_11]PJE59342.1 MAG: glycosyltransferase family 1 protein [Candidatus Portnoybacteria bacterium CG10_big_fil_rev_8_21_14_0_10_43_39]
MKILQINKFFFIKGGVERYFFDLSELLAGKGHQVIPWSVRHDNNFPYPEQNDFAQFIDFSKNEGFFKEIAKGWKIIWNRDAGKKLEKVIQKHQPDIAHVHNIFTHLSPSVISVLKKHDIPVAMTLHDYKFFCPNYTFFTNGETCFACLKKKNYYSCLIKKCVKNSYFKSLAGCLEGEWQKFLKVSQKIDVFLSPSSYLRRKAVEWGIPKEKIFTLPNFIFKEKEVVAGRSEKNYILYFGRLNQEKGVNLLVESFSEIFKNFPYWKLKIVGEGPEEERLKKMVSGREEIEILGRQNSREMKKTIAGANLVVVPSLWPENFPYAVLESFCLARPVIAAKIGGLPELIKDGKTGILFKPGDKGDLKEKIVYAINNLSRMKELGVFAQKEVLRKYNPDKHYQKLIKIYEGIKRN